MNYNKIQCINKEILFSDNYKKQIEHYVNDLRSHISLLNLDDFKILIAFGDISFKLNKFALTKSRPIDSKDNYNILLNLNIKRHWEKLSEIDKYDIPFDKKYNRIVWRGSNTGYYTRGKIRDLFVEKFQNHENKNIDIKYSELFQENKSEIPFILNKLSIEDQLKNKFILSIEGNDVATNLKWIMYSNSLVLMPKPTICSWFMEDKLINGKHYVEIKNDFSDLEEKYDWCLNHDSECEQIAKNGTEFAKQFLDIKREDEITKHVIASYFS
jgi:hypothetical protein